MNTVDLLIGIHNHQPVGNFGHVFEETFEMCYKPQIEVLRAHPGVRMALHFSGPLLEWIEANRPGHLDIVAGLAERGQVEILSGGYYEPILSSIPEDDAIGQIEMMNTYVKKRFGHTPKGMWAAERIWDPCIPRIAAAAGIAYTLLDDTHFFYAGLEAKDMFGYYVTEKGGSALAVFPIDKSLRYSIPFKLPQETIGYLRTAAEAPGVHGVTYGDDGEKFGVWPETYKWVYEEKWLDNFYTALEENGDWIRMTLFSEFLERHPASGRIYLPMASYDEMSEWTLNPDAAARYKQAREWLDDVGKRDEWKPFIRGGQWDNFLVKYEEANRMHKKMLFVSSKLAEAENAGGKNLDAARRELYRGQCNCAYWHGMFGGLYLNYLRHAVYEHLIGAENLLDGATRHDEPWIDIRRFDVDMDGCEEIIIENPALSVGFDPGYGGCLFALDYRHARFNVTNTLTRRREAYHAKISDAAAGGGGEQPASIHDLVKVKEENLAGILAYDGYDRHCFQDRFFGGDVTMDDFAAGKFAERGNFVAEPYEVKRAQISEHGSAVVSMTRLGAVSVNGVAAPLVLSKSFLIQKDRSAIEAQYQVTNESAAAIHTTMGVEFNLTLLAADAPDRYWVVDGLDGRPRLKEKGEDAMVTKTGMRDDWFGFSIILTTDTPMNVWRFPVETVSQSESGFERTYQGSCMVLTKKLELLPGLSSSFAVTLSLEKNA